MKNTNLFKRMSIACCGAILLAGSSVAFSDPKAEHIATLYSLGDGGVLWEPTRKSKYSFIEVSISGGLEFSGDPGPISDKFYYDEEVAFYLDDGSYTYELYKAPPGTAMWPDIKPDRAKNYGPVDHNGRSEQQRAERAPGQENKQRGFIQSGSFTIEGGDLVDETLPEAG